MNSEFVRMAILCFSNHCPGDVFISLRITRALSYFRLLWEEISGCGVFCL